MHANMLAMLIQILQIKMTVKSRWLYQGNQSKNKNNRKKKHENTTPITVAATKKVIVIVIVIVIVTVTVITAMVTTITCHYGNSNLLGSRILI